MSDSRSNKQWSRWALGLLALGVGCGPVVEPQQGLVREEATAQVQQATTTVDYPLNWSSNLTLTGDLCRFGDTSQGHQVATNTRASGRLEESLTLTGLAGRRITSIRLNGSSTTFKYDDVMLLAYNNHLVMASDRRVAEYSASPASLGTSPVLYSWSKVLNGLIDNQNIQSPWCSSGATTCVVPRTETTGSMDVNIPSFTAVDQAAYPSAPDSRTFRLVTIGDDDISLDCRHGPVSLTVTVTHEPAFPGLCDVRGDSSGRIAVRCYHRNANGTFSETSPFTQTISGSGGWTGPWQYGDAMHLTDKNGDGRTDLCVAYGNDIDGKATVACYYRNTDGTFSNTLSFSQKVNGLTGFTGRWQYGESLHFTDFNADGRMDICALSGSSLNHVAFSCHYQQSTGNFSDTPSIGQYLTGTSGYGYGTEWSHGDSMHFTDWNGDGRVDICLAAGNSQGVVQIFCFPRLADGSISNSATYTQTIPALVNFTGRWQYGETLQFTDINGDGREDFCSAGGSHAGHAEVYCFHKAANNTFSSTVSFNHTFTTSSGYGPTTEWQYGESLHFAKSRP